MERDRSRCCHNTATLSSSSAIFTPHSNCIIRTKHHHQPSFFTILVLLVVFFLEGAQSSLPSRSGGNRKMMTSIHHTTSRLCSTSSIRAETFAWIAGPSCFHETNRIRRSCSSIFQLKSTHDPPIPILSHHGRHSTRRPSFLSSISCSALFAHPNPKQSERMQMQRPSIESQRSFGAGTNVNSLENTLQHDAHHWFTYLLPEGWCVGVCTARAAASTMSNNGEESILNSTTLLHSDEYQWGQNNIASDASRTSYYLGRTALRLSLNGLLENERGDITTAIPLEIEAGKEIDMTRDNGNANMDNDFCTQLYDQIQTTAIMKDYHGRPILPAIVLGSISHKGEYAVGLARFRSSSWNNGSNRVVGGLNNEEDGNGLEASVVEWREECPILEEDENIDVRYGDSSTSNSSTASTVGGIGIDLERIGIGIDLERIDAQRGKRIKRKVLTENELKELGRLEEIGVSSEEEVLLRFSLKESVYKAMHPILCQYVGFQEAEITPLSNGTAQVTLNLTSRSHEHLGIVVQSASWRKMGDFFLTSASVGVVPKNES